MSATLVPPLGQPSIRQAAPAPAAATLLDPAPIAHAVAVLCAAVDAAHGPLGERESQALATIYRHYADMLLAAARRVLGSASDAEDAVHDLFCRLPRLLPQYHGRGLGGWLRRAVVTQALMQLRRVRARREECMVEERGAFLTGAATSSDDGEIARALGQLTPQLREVVVLRYFVGYSHGEIAELLEITIAASEVRLCRAIKQLRLMLRGPAHADRAPAARRAPRAPRREGSALRAASSF